MSEGPNTPSEGNQNPGGTPPPNPPPNPPQGGAPPPAPQAPQGQAAAGVGQPADLMTRFLAKLIDWILLSIVNFAIVVPIVIGAIFSGATGGFGFGGSGLVTGAIFAAIAVAYFAILENMRGQTVGKMLLKLQVQGPDGQNPEMDAAFKRNGWMLLSIIPVIGGLAQLGVAIFIAVTINNNTGTRQGWHDEFAGGTRVIKIG